MRIFLSTTLKILTIQEKQDIQFVVVIKKEFLWKNCFIRRYYRTRDGLSFEVSRVPIPERTGFGARKIEPRKIKLTSLKDLKRSEKRTLLQKVRRVLNNHCFLSQRDEKEIKLIESLEKRIMEDLYGR